MDHKNNAPDAKAAPRRLREGVTILDDLRQRHIEGWLDGGGDDIDGFPKDAATKDLIRWSGQVLRAAEAAGIVTFDAGDAGDLKVREALMVATVVFTRIVKAIYPDPS